MAITRSKPPGLDDLKLLDLFKKSEYQVETEDGWTLVVTRYQPLKQPFLQPIFMRPIMLVHGFSQNRHAWTSGGFIKNMLYLGADLHLVELRGHGKSSVALQHKIHRSSHRPLPHDIDYKWDLDSYFLYDLPAVIDEIKRITKRDRIYFCGHSLGGMLGYGIAALTDDLAGLVTIGAPAIIGVGFPLLKMAGWLGLSFPLIDLILGAANVERAGEYYFKQVWNRASALIEDERHERREIKKPRSFKFRYVPTDVVLKRLHRLLSTNFAQRLFDNAQLMDRSPLNLQRAKIADVKWLLREGAELETRACFEQFARWIREGRLACYRANFDFTANYNKINVPLAIIFGDKDPVANLKSTSFAYRNTSSKFLLWRPVRGNSHVELTMGHDVMQICYDIKNLIEYAEKHPAESREDILSVDKLPELNATQ